MLWLDYFNSVLSRGDGRRIRLDKAVKNPELQELIETARRLNYSPVGEEAFHPKRSFESSGYISIERKKPKGKVIEEIASILTVIRGEKRKKN